MTTDSNGEVYGAKFFTWAVIVGAAFLLLASVTNFTPSAPKVQAGSPAVETVVAAPQPGHAS
jgi:hypothetical protein